MATQLFSEGRRLARSDAPVRPQALPRLGSTRRSARVRILGWFVAMMAVAIGASLLVERQVLLIRLQHRVDTQMAVDVAALNQEAAQQSQRSVASLFSSYLHSHLPGPDAEFVTLVDGRVFASSINAPYPLTRMRGLMHDLASLTSSLQGSTSTPGGSVRYLAVPVTEPGSVPGTFIDATFTGPSVQEANGDVAVAAAVSLSTLLVMALIAWAVAGRVLAPVRSMTETALSISDTDLTRRISTSGDDEIARLAGAFNSMLDRLQGAFQSQGQFVSDAGHELRTPITVIRGHLELLGDDPIERQETMGVVRDELDRMSRMVDDLLLLAKAERPGFLRLAPVALEDLVQEVMAKVPALGERAWSGQTTGSLTVMADRQRLTQALMNLADNAVRHTRGGDRITLGFRADPSHYRLWVSDTGTGIAAEDRHRIFERFARGRNERRRADAGAGLGLAIVRAISEAHRGTVELASSVGHGSTFTLVLPIVPADDAAWPGEVEPSGREVSCPGF